MDTPHKIVFGYRMKSQHNLPRLNTLIRCMIGLCRPIDLTAGRHKREEHYDYVPGQGLQNCPASSDSYLRIQD